MYPRVGGQYFFVSSFFFSPAENALKCVPGSAIPPEPFCLSGCSSVFLAHFSHRLPTGRCFRLHVVQAVPPPRRRGARVLLRLEEGARAPGSRSGKPLGVVWIWACFRVPLVGWFRSCAGLDWSAVCGFPSFFSILSGKYQRSRPPKQTSVSVGPCKVGDQGKPE